MSARQPSDGLPAENLTQRLERLYTGIVFDVMRAMGIPPGVLPPDLRDVYKRQSEESSPIRAISRFSGWQTTTAPAGAAVNIRVQSRSCLLYTSRCV